MDKVENSKIILLIAIVYKKGVYEFIVELHL